MKEHHKQNNKKKKKRNPNNDNVFNFKIPFISNNINRKITNAFKSEGINVRLCHQSYTLRNALKQPDALPTMCKLLNCPISNPKLCYQRKVVYQLKCQHCNNIYIGSTIRDLHIRIKEHYTTRTSSVFQHKQTCNSNFTTSVVNRDSDPANLRLKEGLMIRKLSPSINSRAESEEISIFLF